MSNYSIPSWSWARGKGVVTMFRYLVAFSNSKNAEDKSILNKVRHRLATSPDKWHDVFSQPNLVAVYTPQPSENAVAMLQDSRGAVFGPLYATPRAPEEDSSPRQLKTLSSAQSITIIRSRGRSLISEFWGHYVAVIRYPETASIVVVRSPASPLPCFHFKVGTVSIFFSCIEDCLMLGVRDFSINWDSITAQVVGGDYLTDETGINDIRNLNCGEAISCASTGETIEAYWDPIALLANRKAQSFADAASNVRKTTEYCVHALASSHSGILVSLSGGLDSSIVLSALSRSPHRPSIVATNYYSRGCGDERRFARLMARSARCAILEQSRNDRLDLHGIIDCNFTLQPVLNFSAPDTEARTIAQARQHEATAIFNGELGDNVFGNSPKPGALIECLRLHGVGSTFLRAMLNYSMLTRQSLWRSLGLLRREYELLSVQPNFSASAEISKRYGKDKAQSMMLASFAAGEEHREMADRFLHPWLQRSRRLAPGSHMLMYGLIVVTSTAYHSPFSHAGDPPHISPFISQPLVEIALQTPAHLHFQSGLDRAIARSAFSDVLPAAILQRGLGKGGPNLWAKDVVDCNTAFLREFLLDGILVQRNLVDRVKVESALSATIEKSTSIVGDIFAKIYIESWLRKANSLLHLTPARRQW